MMHYRPIRTAVLTGCTILLQRVLPCLMLAAPAALLAQDDAAVQPLRVYVECEPCGPDALQPAGYVAWTADSARADVHVHVGAAPDGAAGYALSFRGRGAFAGRADTLHYVTAPGLADAPRAGLVHMVHVGLVRYVADTPLAARLRIGFAPDPAAAAPAGAQTGPRPVSQSQSATPAAASAQPGAGSSARPAAQPKRWAAGVELGFSGSSGNSDFVALTSGVRIRHLQTNRFRLDWSANYRYGESGGTVAARHAQSKLDFDVGPGARVAPFISASAERDPFRRIDLRGRGGTGVRVALQRSPRGEASLRGALLYTHERFSEQAARPPNTEGVWSFKFIGNRQLGESIKLETSSSYDPVLGDFADYNLDVTSKLSTRITRRLALTLSHTYAYDATPVTGVQPSDQRFQTGLTVDF